MIKGYQEQVLAMYEKLRSLEQKQLEERRKEVEMKCPRVLDIERDISKLCIKVSINALKSSEDQEQVLRNLKKHITDLKVEKAELLVANGFDPDYISIRYKCNKCKDTGFIGSEKCSCFKQKLIRLHYKNSHLEDKLNENNFRTFDMNLFSAQKIGNERFTPKKNMECIYAYVINYIKGFENTNDNLLFYGKSGTGKTFMSDCIAKELLDRGHLVVYRTSDELIQNLKEIKYENNSSLEDLIYNCDLLIIDDLGSESLTDFSKTEFFNLLNKKLLLKKKMLISSNLTIEDLAQQYSERISSRLLGNFELFKFYNEDIRMAKNFEKQSQRYRQSLL